MKTLQTATRLDHGNAHITLVNMTNSAIDYVVGGTKRLFLPEQSNVALQPLPLPVVVKFHRHDGDLLDVRVCPTGSPRVLQITLDESADCSAHCLAIEIEDDGTTVLN